MMEEVKNRVPNLLVCIFLSIVHPHFQSTAKTDMENVNNKKCTQARFLKTIFWQKELNYDK